MVAVDYYERRAPYYDAVYDIPERQDDLRRLRALVPPVFAGRHVLEVAAGTGYWTRLIADTASAVHATDYNPGPLAIAAGRDYPRGNVTFDRADAFALDEVPGRFDAGFAGFWWSHVPLAEVDRFLSGLCARLRPGSHAAFVDNRYVEGSSTPIARIDADGNTYQLRALRDGTSHEVLKNFPSADDALEAANRHGMNAEFVELTYYWLLTFTTA